MTLTKVRTVCRHLLAVMILSAGLCACGSDSPGTGPEPLEGTYLLVRYDGESVPVDFDTRTQVVQGELVLEVTGVCRWKQGFLIDATPIPLALTADENCTWQADTGGFTVEFDNAPLSGRGVPAGDRLHLSLESLGPCSFPCVPSWTETYSRLGG